jgi:hypothetical protein
MKPQSHHTIASLLASNEPEELREGLSRIKEEISKVGSQDAKPLFEMLSAIFYIDPLDRPDLVPIRDEAISLVIGFGKWVIPALIQNLDDGDLKAQIVTADALGRMGADAIEPLMSKYETSTDLATRAFCLYALGKIRSPKIAAAAPIALDAAESPDRELRDTATRAIGRFAASIPESELPEDIRSGFIEKLYGNLKSTNKGIRAKAVRSLGKLAKHGHMTEAECKDLKAKLIPILGRDENFAWDYTYVVRKEAEEALQYL